MYIEFFQLREMPFSITPDPAYLYLSPRHQEALGHLLYGTGRYGGFVQLTGEVGTGKTTIVRSLLAQKLPDVDVAMIHNPRQNEHEFVQTICDELGVAYPREAATLKTLVDALNEHLLRTHAAGRRTVLIIDEAQNLPPSVLEQVRLLTNLETAKDKLLRIMLVGQPELSVLLARPELRQLASRISARFHLTPLSAQETREYVEHRLRVAGCRSQIFQPRALAVVHRHSRGIPRLINIICDRALLGAYARRVRFVSAEIARHATREVMGEQPLTFDPRAPLRWRWIERAWLAALVASAGLFVYSYSTEEPIFSEPAAHRPNPPPPPAAIGPLPDATTALVSDAAAGTAPAPQLMPRLPVATLGDLQASVQPLSIVMGRLVRLWEPRLALPFGENVCDALQARRLECYR
ncbi:MAG: AAA family ATPase, partial [Pseudomonadota bacterium]